MTYICPKCNGTMVYDIESNARGERYCIQCGHRAYPKPRNEPPRTWEKVKPGRPAGARGAYHVWD